MILARAEFAALLLLVPTLAGLYLWGFRRRRQAMSTFVTLNLASRLVGSYSWSRRIAKASCFVAAVGFLAAALMQPQWGRDLEDTSRRGRDIFILLDVSLSMLAEDSEPNRLEAAKAGVTAFVDSMRQFGGNRLALVTFAGRASLQSPLTLDYDFFLNRLYMVSPESVDRRGSSLGSAIQKTLYGFGAIDPTYTDIIIVSDGEDHGSGPIDAARTAVDEGVSVYTVGVGDASGGARIPIESSSGQRSYLRFEGEDVVSVMKEMVLRDIARLGDGAYVRVRTGPVDFISLYMDHISSKAQRDLETSASEALIHRYHWFVIVAVMCLALEMIIRERPTPVGEV
ncbi:MAG: VWA domain-containing protein [Alphaproteobacteria bacterium]|nr:VWA domain-containing protein [Alphaproteobacteria bacterium]